jgi:hypothetical protein
MNVILMYSDQVPWYTDMAATFLAMGVDPRSYDWYVSSVETNVPVPVFSEHEAWVTGDELAVVLAAPIQFSWAVFSAFPRGVRVDVSSPPDADGNPTFWHPPEVRPQLEGACFEVVCWDSSATILIGVSPQQAERFSQAYPDTKLLSSTWPNQGP